MFRITTQMTSSGVFPILDCSLEKLQKIHEPLNRSYEKKFDSCFPHFKWMPFMYNFLDSPKNAEHHNQDTAWLVSFQQLHNCTETEGFAWFKTVF